MKIILFLFLSYLSAYSSSSTNGLTVGGYFSTEKKEDINGDKVLNQNQKETVEPNRLNARFTYDYQRKSSFGLSLGIFVDMHRLHNEIVTLDILDGLLDSDLKIDIDHFIYKVIQFNWEMQFSEYFSLKPNVAPTFTMLLIDDYGSQTTRKFTAGVEYGANGQVFFLKKDKISASLLIGYGFHYIPDQEFEINDINKGLLKFKYSPDMLGSFKCGLNVNFGDFTKK